MKNTSFTIIQLNVAQKEKNKNIAAVNKILAESTAVGDITLLPELFSTGYLFDSAEEIHSLSEEFSRSHTINCLSEMARTYETMFVAGIAEKEGDEYYNTVAVVDQKGLRYKYRKISQNQFDKQYFSRGDSLLTFEHKGLKIGVAICFDIWFPEIMRKYKDVDVILHPANFGGQHSFAVAQARALESGQHVVTCNRVGEDITTAFTAKYCGGSRVYSPKGEMLFQLDGNEACKTLVLEDLSLAPQFSGICPQSEMDAISKVLS
ncbi:carbon-nitrogen hydrolase family protein [Photobacterium rosenbergii]|uniref:Carbon-nitrogen hydrolase family protein n=1 Tax=Photobacterium rosenbergii TaxID=294936 RepID=A0A2T3NKS6_9GAMM|nr:carbon-nitrogen hydrolase family protein [Photobacterium rosenbergii]PSW16118.1 carbon-nitrogen hydrolase family protein [Photobacterium rosenbergii]